MTPIAGLFSGQSFRLLVIEAPAIELPSQMIRLERSLKSLIYCFMHICIQIGLLWECKNKDLNENVGLYIEMSSGEFQTEL